jgi:hypothetical protein
MTQDWQGDAYCVRCKDRVPTTGYIEETNGRFFAKGFCPQCGGKVTRILGSTPPAAPAKADDILDQRAGYGDPTENHARIAALWTTYLGTEIRADQVAVCFVLAKISRSVTSPDNPDHYIDIKGYADIARECAGA